MKDNLQRAHSLEAFDYSHADYHVTKRTGLNSDVRITLLEQDEEEVIIPVFLLVV